MNIELNFTEPIIKFYAVIDVFKPCLLHNSSSWIILMGTIIFCLRSDETRHRMTSLFTESGRPVERVWKDLTCLKKSDSKTRIREGSYKMRINPWKVWSC